MIKDFQPLEVETRVVRRILEISEGVWESVDPVREEFQTHLGYALYFLLTSREKADTEIYTIPF